MKITKLILGLVLMVVLSISVIAVDVSISDYDPKPAEAGKYMNIWFKVENPGSQPEGEFYLEIFPKDGLELSPGEAANKRVGIIQAKNHDNIQYRLRVRNDAFDGPNQIEVHLIKDTTITEFDLVVEVEEKDFLDVDLQIGDVESDPTRIKPDDEDVKLEVTIQNLGDGKAQGVKAELTNLPEGITVAESYAGTSLLGNIEADATSMATFYVDVDESVPAGTHFADVLVTYKFKPDEDEDDFIVDEATIPLQINVKETPLYEIVSVELSQETLRAGDSDVKMRVTVKNVGEEDGESVRIKVYSKSEQPFDFDVASDFIAPVLEPGEQGQATLEFDVEDDANLQIYNLDIELKNVVGDDVLTYQKKIPLEVALPRRGNPLGLIVIGIIIIAGVGFFYLRNHRKSKKKSQSKKVQGNYGSSFLDDKKK